MSYEVLARKWRPQGFDDVVGQAHVTTPLRNAIRSDRVPHAILLTGPRGVGKTSLARILARCLNCEKGPTDTPCGECPACREITEGRSTDVQEIDAASRTSVDDVRELIEAVRYAPAPGKYRIFVVDEVHMLSTAAFNALLKTLEEPPPRSLFVFATTNPEKIPFTVVSRCQRYDLRRIAAREIVDRLRLISGDEKVEISDHSLLAIAREADGSLRDAQTLLDQVIAYGGAQIDDEQVVQVLDLIDRRLLLAILEACVDGDAAESLAACARAGAMGVDAKRLGENLVGLLRDLVVLRIAPDTAGLVEGSDAEIAELREIAGRTDAARLRRMFRALIREQEDLAWAPRPFAVLEMAAVRLATLAEGEDVARLLTRLDALERQLAGGSGGPAGSSGGSGSGRKTGDAERAARETQPKSRRPRQATAPPTAPVATPEAAQAEPSAPSPEPETAQAEPAASTPEPKTAQAEPAASSPAPEAARVESAASTPEPISEAPAAGAPLEVVFERLRAFVRKEHHGLAAALEGGRLAESEPGRLRILAPNRFAAQRLAGRRETLVEICSRFFDAAVAVTIETANSASASAAPDDPEALRLLRQRALDHPAVGRALDTMAGEIAEIRPLGNPDAS